MASEEDSDRSESRQDRGASDVELTVASSPLQLEVKLSHDGSDVVDAQSVAVPPGTNQQRLQQMVCDQFGLTCSLSDVRCTCFCCCLRDSSLTRAQWNTFPTVVCLPCGMVKVLWPSWAVMHMAHLHPHKTTSVPYRCSWRTRQQETCKPAKYLSLQRQSFQKSAQRSCRPSV